MHLSALNWWEQPLLTYAQALSRFDLNMIHNEDYQGRWTRWTWLDSSTNVLYTLYNNMIYVTHGNSQIGDHFVRLANGSAPFIGVLEKSNDWFENLATLVLYTGIAVLTAGSLYAAYGGAAGVGTGATSLTSSEVAALYGDVGYSGVIASETAPALFDVAAVSMPAVDLSATLGADAIASDLAISGGTVTAATGAATGATSLVTASQVIGVASGAAGLVKAIAGNTPQPGHTAGIDTPLYNPATGLLNLSAPPSGNTPLFGSSNMLIGIAAAALFGVALLHK